MNILLSAYHCAPNWGSESAIGWNFAVQLKKLGHNVTVITSDSRKPAYVDNEDYKQSGLEVIFFGLPSWMKRIYKPASVSEQFYYYLWQIGLYFFCKEIIKRKKIELIHHITLGVFRVPSFLYLHNVPLVFGPVGGGEECPINVRKSLPAEFNYYEKIRNLSNRLSALNPSLYFCFKKCSLILIKTNENLKYIPKSFHYKCKTLIEVGIEEVSRPLPVTKEYKEIKILFAGRLIYVKGLHLAIRAFAEIYKKYPNVTFTIIGSGKNEAFIKNIAIQENINDNINWIPKVDQKTLFQMYQDYDLLLFPSLHDSSGGVVLESLSFGLPVVCLDLGGPKEIVNDSCGVIIKTSRKNEQEIIKEIALAIGSLIENPNTIKTMSKNALLTAEAYTWKKVVKRCYDLVLDSLDLENAYKGKTY